MRKLLLGVILLFSVSFISCSKDSSTDENESFQHTIKITSQLGYLQVFKNNVQMNINNKQQIVTFGANSGDLIRAYSLDYITSIPKPIKMYVNNVFKVESSWSCSHTTGTIDLCMVVYLIE